MHRKSMEVAQTLNDPALTGGKNGNPMLREQEQQLQHQHQQQQHLEDKKGNFLGEENVNDFRTNSIAALRAKAHEHSVRILAEGSLQHQQMQQQQQQQHQDENVFVD